MPLPASLIYITYTINRKTINTINATTRHLTINARISCSSKKEITSRNDIIFLNAPPYIIISSMNGIGSGVTVFIISNRICKGKGRAIYTINPKIYSKIIYLFLHRNYCPPPFRHPPVRLSLFPRFRFFNIAIVVNM